MFLVFVNADPAEIGDCSLVMTVWGERAQRAITLLDRARGFPPLSLPTPDSTPE